MGTTSRDSGVAPLTELLRAWTAGDPDAGERLFATAYPRLRSLCGQRLHGRMTPLTLQPTELVNEVYLVLARQRRVDWQSREQFFALASTFVRRILTDHAKGRRRGKRGHGVIHISVDDVSLPTPGPDIDVVALDQALTELAAISVAAARIVELRFFGGLSLEQTARQLSMSRATAARRWRFGKSVAAATPRGRGMSRPSPELWRRAEEIFNAALELTPDARSAYVARAARHDEELRAAVERLLSANRPDDDTELRHPFIDPRLPTASPPDIERSPRLGEYRLLEPLGRGGMAAVYLAERISGGVERRVAIKLIPDEALPPGRQPTAAARSPDPRPLRAPQHRPFSRCRGEPGWTTLRGDGVHRGHEPVRILRRPQDAHRRPPVAVREVPGCRALRASPLGHPP